MRLPFRFIRYAPRRLEVCGETELPPNHDLAMAGSQHQTLPKQLLKGRAA